MYWLSHVVFLALSTLALAYVDPYVVTGNTTPVHDPTVCKDVSGKYYLFTTARGLEIRTSMDRTNWTYEGLVFPDGASWTDEYTGAANGSAINS